MWPENREDNYQTTREDEYSSHALISISSGMKQKSSLKSQVQQPRADAKLK